jgi:hypothetical protein
MLKNWRFIIVLSWGLTSPAWALVVSPARTEVHLVPGTSLPVELVVTNDDKEEVQVDVSRKDWFIPEANKAWTVDRWLDVHGPPQFSLRPGQTQKVGLTLSCPEGISGEVVGMVSFVYRTAHPSTVTPMISVSMYVIAKGLEKMDGLVKDMTVRTWHDQVYVSALVRSTGNVHLRPSGRLVVEDAQDKELAAIPVAEGTPTYPGTENIYGGPVPANVKLPPGTYQAKADLQYQDLKLGATRTFTVLQDGQIQMSPMK